MTPEEVESRVVAARNGTARPAARERAALGRQVRTDITIDFAEGTDIYWRASRRTGERYAQAELPAGISAHLAPISTPLSDMLDVHDRRRRPDWPSAAPARLIAKARRCARSLVSPT